VPEGAESHFKVVIVSSAFEGKKLVARHRLLNGILAKTFSTHIHALALHTMTKEEWSISQQAPASPPCMGGGVHR
jgi:BolA protein